MTVPNHLQALLCRLNGMKAVGDQQWQALCPAHDDKTPSLSVSTGADGKILLYCHAGCELTDILQALGLEEKDLFPPSTNGTKQYSNPTKTTVKVSATKQAKSKSTESDIYNYEDEKGTLLYQVCRKPGKQFIQRRPDADGGWNYELNGVRRVLYQLPRLAAMSDDSYVYVCAGEKDPNRLISEGMYATCNSGGEGNFGLCDSSALHGHNVIVLEDNDTSGRKHSLDVATILHDKAKSIRILALPDLPAKGDVSDFLDTGNDPEDLDTLAVNTPLWEPSLDEVDSDDSGLKFSVDRKPNTVKVQVTATLKGEPVHIDTFDLGSVSKRIEFAKAVHEKTSGFEPSTIETELLQLAAITVSLPEAGEAEEVATTRDALLDRNDKQTEKLLSEMFSETVEEARQLLLADDLFEKIASDIVKMGVVGEGAVAQSAYCIFTSRLLTKPLSAKTQGLSSSGKSFINTQVATLIPSEAKIPATSMSNQSLFYMPAGALIHKVVIGGERSRVQNDETAEATRAMRELQSEGELNKLVAVSEGGEYITSQVHQDGPIAFVETTTLTKIFDEDANRCLISSTDESSAQTALVMQKIAEDAEFGPTDNTHTVEKHHALQRLLKRVEVRIPFARKLNALMASEKVEARRAFSHVLEMIKVVALIHQYQRTEHPQHGGVINAIPQDYAIARSLLIEPIARSLGGQLAPTAKKLYGRLHERYGIGVVFAASEAEREDKHIHSNMTSYLRTIADMTGAIEIIEAGSGSKSSTWKIATELPDDIASALPTIEQLMEEA